MRHQAERARPIAEPSRDTSPHRRDYVKAPPARLSRAAAAVAEGGLKPESVLGYSTLDEPIEKVATTVIISDELLEDALCSCSKR